MAIGDVNSEARGAGARFNDGKPPFELVPAGILAEYAHAKGNAEMTQVLHLLGRFQMLRDEDALYEALRYCMTPHSLAAAARVFDYGRLKYAEWNWLKGMPWSVPIGCVQRHALALIEGHEADPESGLPHAGHLLCNLIMLWQYRRTYAEGDDRPRIPV